MAINTSRVILGGLAAGLVMNVIGGVVNGMLLGPRMTAEMDAAAPGLSANMTMGPTIGVNVLSEFVIGILIVWIYAAIRPRFGPGLRTAMYAGVVPWICGLFFYSGWLLTGMMTAGTYAVVSVVALINVLAGAAVGAWLYREEGVGAPARA
jgi:hypothetical protein